MEFELEPKILVDTLKRLVPKKRGLVKRWSTVTIDAHKSGIDLTGEFDNTWSVPAAVVSRGSCAVDLMALMKPLRLYPQNEKLTFKLHPDGLRFGTTKLRLHPPVS